MSETTTDRAAVAEDYFLSLLHQTKERLYLEKQHEEVRALDAALEVYERYPKVVEEMIRLRGGPQETLKDHHRKGLFKGSAIDYVRHRALKHEVEYRDTHSRHQAHHLRRIATEMETKMETLQAQVERLRAALHELQAEASTLTVWLNKTKVTTTLNLDGAAIEARRVLAETAGAAE